MLRFAPLLPLLLAPLLHAQEAPQALTIERIYASREFSPEDFGPVRWLDDGGYTALERDARGHNFIARYEPESGNRAVLVSAEELTAKNSERPLPIADYQWSKDGQRLLIMTNTRRVWRYHTRGDFWVLDRVSGELIQLGTGLDATWLQFAKFSPDARRVAYVYRNNIYTEVIGSGKPIAVTSDGSETRIYGTFDWVYEEEWSLRDGIRWSPDGNAIAFWQIDGTGVKKFPLVDLTSELYPTINWISYPKAGTTNPAARVGVLRVGSIEFPEFMPEAMWVDLPGDSRENYVARMDYTPDGMLLIQQINRRQDTIRVWEAQPVQEQLREVFVDHDEAWAEVCDDIVWLDEAGREFTWLSERSGWRHIWRISRDGAEPVNLTPVEYDVISVLKIDPQRNVLWFLASPEDATTRYLFRAPLDASAEPVRVTPKAQAGWHNYQISPDGEFAIHRWSSKSVVPQVELLRLATHEAIQSFPSVDNARLSATLDRLPKVEESSFQVRLQDGTEIDGWMMKPPHFDPQHRWPLLIHVYGEPAGQTVMNNWGSAGQLWHRFLAEQGYVVISMDNRGTPAPKGRDWRKVVYGSVGDLASREQAEATERLLEEHSWLDRDRVGIWGWSGGGSMTLNALFRYPETYTAGLSVAFVADQRYYDTIYQERYMYTPQGNPDGYRAGSPIHHAAGLEDPILLIYGTGDDNTHYQNCEALINELIRLGKQFDQLAYPNRTHGIYEGEGTTLHLRHSMLRWWRDHLPAGPRD